MIDPTPNERAAFVHGGELGGEYLDSIGKTDLEIAYPVEPSAAAQPQSLVATGACA